jgi:outer membrane protein W
MIKNKFTRLLFIALVIILQTNFAFPQDSTKSKCSDEFTALKKGNFAINFELGYQFFRNNSPLNNTYSDSYYELILSAKLHLTDRLALRISGGTDISSGRGEYDGQITNSDEINDNYSFNTSVNLQYFLSQKSKVKPFFSGGIYGNYIYYLDNTYGWNKRKSWSIGPIVTFGVEMFVLDNMSFIGEYVMKATMGKSYREEWSSIGSNYYYKSITEYKLDFKSFRAGLSVYF